MKHAAHLFSGDSNQHHELRIRTSATDPKPTSEFQRRSMGSLKSDVLHSVQPHGAGQKMCLATVLAIAFLSCAIAAAGVLLGFLRSL